MFLYLYILWWCFFSILSHQIAPSPTMSAELAPVFVSLAAWTFSGQGEVYRMKLVFDIWLFKRTLISSTMESMICINRYMTWWLSPTWPSHYISPWWNLTLTNGQYYSLFNVITVTSKSVRYPEVMIFSKLLLFSWNRREMRDRVWHDDVVLTGRDAAL